LEYKQSLEQDLSKKHDVCVFETDRIRLSMSPDDTGMAEKPYFYLTLMSDLDGKESDKLISFIKEQFNDVSITNDYRGQDRIVDFDINGVFDINSCEIKNIVQYLNNYELVLQKNQQNTLAKYFNSEVGLHDVVKVFSINTDDEILFAEFSDYLDDRKRDWAEAGGLISDYEKDNERSSILVESEKYINVLDQNLTLTRDQSLTLGLEEYDFAKNTLDSYIEIYLREARPTEGHLRDVVGLWVEVNNQPWNKAWNEAKKHLDLLKAQREQEKNKEIFIGNKKLDSHQILELLQTNSLIVKDVVIDGRRCTAKIRLDENNTIHLSKSKSLKEGVLQDKKPDKCEKFVPETGKKPQGVPSL
jgi:hypothetical protein